VGQKVQVELKEIDPRGKLSLGAVLAEEGNGAAPAGTDPNAPGESADATSSDAAAGV
jgi:polyribonucleotide nucleotidyltransferase